MDQAQPYVAVVGIDYSPNSMHALGEALDLVSARGGVLHVLHVEHKTLTEASEPDAAAAAAAETAVQLVRQRTSDKITELSSRHGALRVAKVIAHYRRGSAAEEIVQLAADVDADLIVVGSHGHRAFERFLVGSVAERTNRLARCPVLTVRPKDYDASGRVPAIEPPCPDCLAKRAATNGKELWCARHSEHHARPHVLTYSSDPTYGQGAKAYEATPT